MNPTTLLLSLLAALPQVPPAATSLTDENPRHVRYDTAVIEHVSLEPRAVAKVGERAGLGASGPDLLTVTVHIRNASPVRASTAIAWGPFVLAHPGTIGAGERQALAAKIPADRLPFDQPVQLYEIDDEGQQGDQLDIAWIPRPDAIRIALVVERRTLEAGDARFGSFVRRMRHSLDDLHALFEDTSVSLSPDARLVRAPIRDRFRIDHVATFDRREGERPPLFDGHDTSDLVIVCDEGGPVSGFHAEQRSIGHPYVDEKKREGLLSDAGEQTLWREILRSRGVPDFSRYLIAAGALPGRAGDALPLPAHYARDVMAGPGAQPAIGGLPAAICNAGEGIGRVGDAGGGHRPGQVEVIVQGGEQPLVGAAVRWYRARPMSDSASAVHGVPAGATPDGQATTDGAGRAVIAWPPGDRSLWLLVEIEHGGERRFEIIYDLDLLAASLCGDRDRTTRTLDFAALRVIQ